MPWRLLAAGCALIAAVAAGDTVLLRHQRNALTAEVARVTAEAAQYRAAALMCRDALREQAGRELKFEVSHGVRGDPGRLGRFPEG